MSTLGVEKGGTRNWLVEENFCICLSELRTLSVFLLVDLWRWEFRPGKRPFLGPTTLEVMRQLLSSKFPPLKEFCNKNQSLHPRVCATPKWKGLNP